MIYSIGLRFLRCLHPVFNNFRILTLHHLVSRGQSKEISSAA
jgi:hypothetical protein